MTLASVRTGRMVLRGALIVAAAALAVLAATAASAQEAATTSAPAAAAEPEPAKITAAGAASRVVAADTTVIRWGTSVLRDTAAEAADAGEAVFAKVREALETAGVTDDDLATTSVRLAPEWDYRGEARTISGYRWSTQVRLSMEGTAAAGTLIDAIAGAGGDDIRINGVDFTAEITPALERDLLEAAVRDAIAQAAAAGEAIGRADVRPAEVLSASVHRQGPPVGPYEIAGDGTAATTAAAGPTVVAARVAMAFTARTAADGDAAGDAADGAEAAAAEADEAVSIWIDGSAARELEPDETRISFEISVLHARAGTAVANGSAALAQVLARVRALETDAQVFTRSVSLYQERNWVAGESVPVGFRYRVELTSAADGTDGAGALLRALVQGGGNAVRINGISFTAGAAATAQRELLGEAIADAGRVAGIISAALGLGTPRAVEARLGAVEAVAEEEAEYAADEESSISAGTAAIRAPSTIPGAQSVSTTVRVRFELPEQPPAEE